MLQDLETLARTGSRRMAKKHQKNRRPSLLRKGRLLASGKVFALALFYFELGGSNSGFAFSYRPTVLTENA
ncbi:hypothetical protein M0R45_037369 [Rubus argutus]|uniref:Uncharacterized protein n=1 Tax=Rubus argutus TaxID=59490 RepID=A0AAW1W230_RUBAR